MSRRPKLGTRAKPRTQTNASTKLGTKTKYLPKRKRKLNILSGTFVTCLTKSQTAVRRV